MIQNEKKDQEDQWLDMTYKEKKTKISTDKKTTEEANET